MGNESYIDIIVFAVLAGVLILRLRSVLGRRTGNEKPPQENERFGHIGREAETEDTVVPMPQRDVQPPAEPVKAPEEALDGLEAIQAADPNFVPEAFLGGARRAFEMVLEAFAEGDVETLRNLLNDDVFANFKAAIEDRQAAGERLETDVVSFIDIAIDEAALNGREAAVTVRFVTEQVNLVSNADGEIVEGNPEQTVRVVDLWTFARDVRARDPNWRLVATDSPEDAD